MKKRFVLFVVCIAIAISVFSLRSTYSNSYLEIDNPIKIDVVTSYAGSNSNRAIFEDNCAVWEQSTGNIINNRSVQIDNAWKQKILMDFETGNEPDVLQYFVGVDSDSLIQSKKVVSLQEIREEYPDYASNMDDTKIPVSHIDNKAYAVPSNGDWQMLYINKNVLNKMNIAIPDENTSWEEFMQICQQVQENNIIPIGISLGKQPDYLWEYVLLNTSGTQNHLVIPSNSTTADYDSWVNALNTIKQMSDLKFFPEDTTTIEPATAYDLFFSGKAAFMFGSSNQMRVFDVNTQLGSVYNNKENEMFSNNFTVSYVPSSNSRKTTDIIGGMSTGYFITTKCWEDSAKREVAVDFIKSLTNDKVVTVMSDYYGVNALKNTEIVPYKLTNIHQQVSHLLTSSTSMTSSVIDYAANSKQVEALIENISLVSLGKLNATDAVNKVIAQ